MSNIRTIQNIPQKILQNNLKEITDLLDNMISTEENNLTNIMRRGNIPRQHRQMALRLERMLERLQHINQLLNAYLAVVVHRVLPQIQSRRIGQAYRVFQESNIWQRHPGIVRTERRRLTELSDRLDNLESQVRHVIFYLRSLSLSR